MKGKNKNEKTTVGRIWCNNGRVCNHHASCGWFCWSASEHPQIRGGKANAFRNGSRCANFAKTVNDSGAVTAEFLVILPAACLILLTALSLTQLQMQRFQLIELSAESSRAIARGEAEDVIAKLIKESGRNIEYSVEYKDISVCVELSCDSPTFLIGQIKLSEQSCARKGGL